MTKKTEEIRSFGEFSIRDGTDEGGGAVIEGYPVVFDKASEDLGGFIEFVTKGAFDDVDFSDVLLVDGHDMNMPLARTSAETLSFDIDDHGLKMTATLPNTTYARDVLENIRVGNIRGMSFGFTIKEDDWRFSDNWPDEPDVRHILKIDRLFEVSVTPFPAYKDTSVALAERDAHRRNIDDEQRNRNRLRLAKQKQRSIEYDA